MESLPKSLTINACESVLSKIVENESVSLELPVESSRFSFAGMATAIQAAITWGRTSSSGALHLRETTKPNEYQIDEVLKMPHKFVAAMMAKSITTASDAGVVDLRKEINKRASSQIDNQMKNKFGTQRGALCWFAFIDHSSKGFVDNFYLEQEGKKPEPRSAKQIQSVVSAMVAKSSEMAGGAITPSNKTLDDLGRIFFELFLNTHEHGSRALIRDKWIKPGVRVIYSNGINLTKDATEGVLKEDPILTSFVGSSAERERNRYVEISIIDSGLGLVKRWITDHSSKDYSELTIKEEYQIIKKCFSFSHGSTGLPNKGNGLPVVMERLTSLKGFMRIRSGRLSMYRDFVASPYSELESPEFYDWKSMKHSNLELTENSPVEGVAITFLIPLEEKS